MSTVYNAGPYARWTAAKFPTGSELVAVLTNLENLWIFDPVDMQSLMGPLPINLAGLFFPTSIAINESASRLFSGSSADIAGYDMEGAELWSDSNDSTWGLGFAGGYLFNTSRTTEFESNDTLDLQARNQATGTVVASARVAQNLSAPYTCGAVGMAIRRNASGAEQLFLLHGIQSGSVEDIILTRWNLGFNGGVSISSSGSRTIHKDSSTSSPFPQKHFGVAAGPDYIYSLLRNAPTTQYDAYDPESFADVDAQDFPNPVPGPSLDALEVYASPPLFVTGTNVGLSKYDLDGTLLATSDATESRAEAKHLNTVSRDTTVAIEEIPSIVRDTSPYTVQGVAPGATFWDLQAAPSGATANATGLVSWPSPVAAGSPHEFRLYASDGASWSVAEWTVTVT
jgi:hypothetical protein